ITVRATLGRRRALLFAIPAVILIVLTLVLRASHPVRAPWPANVLGDFGCSVLLPFTALIIGTGVLGAEIDDGSVIHLLATPVRRADVIATKFAGAARLGPVRRRARRVLRLLGPVLACLGGDDPRDRVRSAVRGHLGGTAQQPRRRRPHPVDRPLLARRRERHLPRPEPPRRAEPVHVAGPCDRDHGRLPVPGRAA